MQKISLFLGLFFLSIGINVAQAQMVQQTPQNNETNEIAGESRSKRRLDSSDNPNYSRRYGLDDNSQYKSYYNSSDYYYYNNYPNNNRSSPNQNNYSYPGYQNNDNYYYYPQ